jgi:DNA-directed RNA polymerase specialized sigma24 family protein
MINKEKKNNKIQEELQRITKILILIATEGKNQREKIETLSNIGFQPKEIAELLGTTPGSVRVALVDIRKKSKRSIKEN